MEHNTPYFFLFHFPSIGKIILKHMINGQQEENGTACNFNIEKANLTKVRRESDSTTIYNHNQTLWFWEVNNGKLIMKDS